MMVTCDCGAIPVIDPATQKAIGVVTDRDIVVKVVAEGNDPSGVRAGEIAQGKPVTIGADDSAEEALRTMAEHQVRRLPVIAGHDLGGMLAQADVARELPDDQVAEILRAVSR